MKPALPVLLCVLSVGVPLCATVIGCSAVYNTDLPTVPVTPTPSPTPTVDTDGDGSPDGEDCQPLDGAIYPDAEERCDGIDNNCDGTKDGKDSVDIQTWYRDLDSDTYGDAAQSTTACNQPVDYVSNAIDCDDTTASRSPSAVEVCDSLDNDCDELVDDADPSIGSVSTWYEDIDGDGFGNSSITQTGCNRPDGYAEKGGDCNDSVATVYPGAAELCGDGFDNDCSTTSPADNGSLYYQDGDGDGYGNRSASKTACVQPTGYVSNAQDCNDSLSTVNPGATEACDGLDNDCDSRIDEEGSTGSSTFFRDADGDTYGNLNNTTLACSLPSGYVTNSSDCDDTSAIINPSGQEVCDASNRDEDCDGKADNDDSSATGKTAFYPDNDGDSFGAIQSINLCDAVGIYIAIGGDCDDTNLTVYPGADELDDDLDNDCNGLIDDNLASTDDDGDGFSDDQGDCDDTDDTIYPGATEFCDGIDNDCTGIIDDSDLDGDGYVGADCGGDDCDDSDSSTHPGAAEDGGTGTGLSDGIDNNCDGTVDNQLPAYDDDRDGYSENQGDCDDSTSLASPARQELPNFFDDDCDGVIQREFLLSQASAQVAGPSAGAWLGFSMATLGDVDGDGIDDLVAGAPGDFAALGAGYLVFGRMDGWDLNSPLTVRYEGEEGTAEAGYSVTSLGDMNRDGYADFAIGSPGLYVSGYSEAGAAYILLGSPSGWQSEVLGLRSTLPYDLSTIGGFFGTSIYGLYTNVRLGDSLASGLSFNSDSFSDLLIGGPCDDFNLSCSNQKGWLMVLNGAAAMPNEAKSDSLYKVYGNTNDAIGSSSAALGDFNGDGYGDLAVGGHALNNQGVVYQVSGSAGIVPANSTVISGTKLTGEADAQHAGRTLVGLGDVTGDGLDDWAGGAMEADANDVGGFVVFGRSSPLASGTLASAASVRFGLEGDLTCPCSAYRAGDLDGDGLAEVVFTAESIQNVSLGTAAVVRVYLFRGSDVADALTVFPSDAALVLESDAFLDDSSRWNKLTVDGGADLNGDGRPDLVVGAPYATPGSESESGAFYLFTTF